MRYKTMLLLLAFFCCFLAISGDSLAGELAPTDREIISLLEVQIKLLTDEIHNSSINNQRIQIYFERAKMLNNNINFYTQSRSKIQKDLSEAIGDREKDEGILKNLNKQIENEQSSVQQADIISQRTGKIADIDQAKREIERLEKEDEENSALLSKEKDKLKVYEDKLNDLEKGLKN